jgi:tRNA U34 5-methylaminomethyl-2-thiouridine-forming methyltransferase MnmC
MQKLIKYDGLEAYPVSAEEWNAMDYTKIEALKSLKEENEQLFQLTWNKWHEINPFFSLYKRKEILQDFKPENQVYDLIYFDAFGPRVQPEMWTTSIFEKLYESLNEGGIFVTYCCKGQVRRDLIDVGFEVEKIPGPPGKREMLRARK